MDWNRNNPRYRRPGRGRGRGVKRAGFFTRLGLRLDRFWRKLSGRKKSSPPKAAHSRHHVSPHPAVEEIFEELNIALPRSRSHPLDKERADRGGRPVGLSLGAGAPAGPLEGEPSAPERADIQALEEDFNDMILMDDPGDEKGAEEKSAPAGKEAEDRADSYLAAPPAAEGQAVPLDQEAQPPLADSQSDLEPAHRAADELDEDESAGIEAGEPPERDDDLQPIAETEEVQTSLPDDSIGHPLEGDRAEPFSGDGGTPPAPLAATARWPKKVFALIILLALIGGGWWGLRSAGFFQQPPTAKVARIPAASLPEVAPLEPGLFEIYAARETEAVSEEFAITSGSTLSQAMEALGLSLTGDGAAIIETLTGEGGVEVVRPGAVVRAVWNREKTALERVEYHPASGSPPLVVRPGRDGLFWRYDLSSAPITVTTAAESVVESSLWEAGSRAGLDAALIMSLSDILASEIDFLADIQTGDCFQVLYSRNYADGRPLSGPVVEMIHMTNKGRTFEYCRYVNSKGDVGYYDPSFRSNKKTFFNSPLQYTRISSRFTMRRLHPIHKVVRPHQGVDYAAPTGTPVSAVADGVVVFAGWNGGYGRLVTIKHDEIYTTMYAHLSRFAKGLKKGTRVAQGDLIGYVGATGTATGPHLDFRLKRNNVFIDPLPEIARQEGKMLEAAEAQAFTEVLNSARRRLKSLLEAGKGAV